MEVKDDGCCLFLVDEILILSIFSSNYSLVWSLQGELPAVDACLRPWVPQSLPRLYPSQCSHHVRLNSPNHSCPRFCWNTTLSFLSTIITPAEALLVSPLWGFSQVWNPHIKGKVWGSHSKEIIKQIQGCKAARTHCEAPLEPWTSTTLMSVCKANIIVAAVSCIIGAQIIISTEDTGS